jgi:TRAP-type mannitol/chloroaromatic compound transport system permease large subunit
MISFSILLVMPFFFVMGYVVKRIDLYALWDAKTDLAKAIYTVFVFDMIFVVRGSFNAMVQPLLIHAIIPIGLIALFATLRQRSLVPRRVGPSTQLAPDRNPEF